MGDEVRVRVLLIDDAPGAGREAALRAALEAADTAAGGHSLKVEVKTQRTGELAAMSGADRGQLADIVLIAISEEDVCVLTPDARAEGGERIPRKACQSVKIGYSLLDDDVGRPDVYFLTRSSVTYGLHVLSLVVSGADGVLDAECVGSQRTAARLLERRRGRTRGSRASPRAAPRLVWSNKSRTASLLAGKPAEALDNLIDVARAGWQIDLRHWELLLALAQVPRDRLGPRTKRAPSSIWISEALNRWSLVTGYVAGANVRRQVPWVFDLLTADEEEDVAVDTMEDRDRRRRGLTSEQMHDLPFLPALARSKGFPRKILPVRNVSDAALTETLYRGLYRVQLYRSEVDEGIQFRFATLPRRLTSR
jgi:hypothetical protein